MKPLFSQRHKAWIFSSDKTRKNNLSFEGRLRTSISFLLAEHARSHAWESEYGGYIGYDDLGLDHMKTVMGIESFDREDVFTKARYADMRLLDLIKRGFPSDVLDSIEAYLYCVENDNKTLLQNLQNQVNNIFKIHGSHWRFVEATAMLIDSFYIAEEVVAVQIEQLENLGASGVIAEFREARNAFQMGNYKTSIQESQKSLESAIKTVVNDNRPANTSELVKKLRTSNILPGQYASFADNFFKLIGTVNAGRSQPGGAHGQGSQVVEIDSNEVELILNLTAVFNKYLSGLYLQQQQNESETTPTDSDTALNLNEWDADDLPF